MTLAEILADVEACPMGSNRATQLAAVVRDLIRQTGLDTLLEADVESPTHSGYVRINEGRGLIL